MKKATIKDVSKATGLSLGTISKYVNGGTVKKCNREKIKIAISELGYSVDDYARGMITNKTKTIGLVIPEFNNLFYAQIASELELALNSYGYNLAVCESFYDVEKERRSISWLASHRMAALVFVPCGHNASDYDYMKEIDMPIVACDQYIEGMDCEFVLVNNRQICAGCIGYLLDNGHKDILIAVAQDGLYTSDERVSGYRDAYAQRGLPVDESKIIHIEENADKAYLVIKDILSKTQCTALFAANYPNTVGAIFAINELRLSIPDELSFVGFDDMMFTRIFRPKLTIIDQPIKGIAEKIKERVFQLMEQLEYDYHVNVLECKFHKDDSMAALAKKGK